MTSLASIHARLVPDHLVVLGAFVEDGATFVMLGPDEPNGFWDAFKKTPEFQDGAPNSMDRWSKRVIDHIATDLGAEAFYPFGGPPYHPFYTWALKTGRVHESPVRLLVHDTAGMWVSFRGVLKIPATLDIPPAPAAPCDTCEEKPCLSQCPISALTAEGYDVPACKSYLATERGAEGCMAQGCRVRAHCPVSESWGRQDGQSAFHMTAFTINPPATP